MAREWGSADWERLLAERGDQLMGTAIALGGSRDAGEDLLQAALERVLRKPRQVDRDMEGYLRRVLYNLAADGWRRRGRWRKKLPLLRSEAILAAADDTVMVDRRDVGAVPVGGVRINPKTPAPPTRAGAWPSSGQQSCDMP